MSFAIDPTPIDLERRLLDALAGLSQIGAAVTRVAPGDWDAAASAHAARCLLRRHPGHSRRIGCRLCSAIRCVTPLTSASRVSAGNWIESQGGVPAILSSGPARYRSASPRALVPRARSDLSLRGQPCAGLLSPRWWPARQWACSTSTSDDSGPLSSLELLALAERGPTGRHGHLSSPLAGQRPARPGAQGRRTGPPAPRRSAHLVAPGPGRDLEAILQMALEVTGARYGIFRLVDGEGRNLVTRALAGEHLDRPLVEALPIDVNSVMGWVAVIASRCASTICAPSPGRTFIIPWTPSLKCAPSWPCP